MNRAAITMVLVGGDVAAATLAWIVALGLRFGSTTDLPPLGPYFAAIPAIALLLPAVLAILGLYEPARGRTVADEAGPLVIAIGLATALLFGADAYYRLYSLATVSTEERFQFSRLFVVLFLVLAVPLDIFFRALIRHHLANLRSRGRNARRVLLIGAGSLGERVAGAIGANPHYGYHLIGFCDDAPELQGSLIAGLPVLGPTSALHDLVHEHHVDDVLLSLPWRAHDRILALLAVAAREGLRIKLAPDLLQHVAIRASFEDIGGVPLLNLSDAPLKPHQRFVKRTVDVVASVLGLVFLSPLFLVLGVLVRRSSPGPALYRQERLGLDGKRFTILKFRTMPLDAESGSGPVWADNDNPRATSLGLWLRRLSADELPQLWNVVVGDMSLVGPRPERPSFATSFKEDLPNYMQRHHMRSGMTGWAQVNGWRGNTSIERRLECDLYYLRNWSLFLDFQILVMTLIRGIDWSALPQLGNLLSRRSTRPPVDPPTPPGKGRERLRNRKSPQ